MIKKIYFILLAGLPGFLPAQGNLIYKLEFPAQYSKYYDDLYAISTNYLEVEKSDHEYAVKITSHALSDAQLEDRVICDDFNFKNYGLKPDLSASLQNDHVYFQAASIRASAPKIVENTTTLSNRYFQFHRDVHVLKAVDDLPILLLVFNSKEGCWSYEKQKTNIVLDEQRSRDDELFYSARFVLPKKLGKKDPLHPTRVRKKRIGLYLPIVFTPVKLRQ